MSHWQATLFEWDIAVSEVIKGDCGGKRDGKSCMSRYRTLWDIVGHWLDEGWHVRCDILSKTL